MKIGLYGILGVYNFGCEAIVRGATSFIRAKYPDAEIIYFTYNYDYHKMARHLQRKDNAWATEYYVRQIYAMLGIKGVTPTFKTTRTAKGGYRKYSYLLRGRKIRYANEVWQQTLPTSSFWAGWCTSPR